VAGSDARERTALIVTVFNEASSIDALLESIAAQTCQPDEIVIVDGGSTDGTWQRLHDWQSRLPLRLERAAGASIARGRNLAVTMTSAEIIAVTDAGVVLDADWFAHLRARLNDGVDVVSGFFEPDARTTFERAMGATVLPHVRDVRAESFLPSSRSMLFRRAAWATVGGYPEWLDYCEDLVFDLALKDAGCAFAFEPAAIARFRPRGSLRAFFVQYFRYARGDGKADLWRRRHAIRYATYAATPFLLRTGWLGQLLVLIGALAYMRRPIARLAPVMGNRSMSDRARAVMLVPVIRLVGDVAKMLGYPVGVWWRLGR
jgi:glycosyltransferase involved in cell wall biosynthesis